MQRIFLPFERLGAENTKTEGTGIGLTLVKQLAEHMQGAVGVESVLGQGSTFWIELPVSPNPSKVLQGYQSESQSSLLSLLSGQGRFTILYIEDNASNLSVMEAVVGEIPQVRLLTAIQGSLGLDMIHQHHPDLVLLDLHLPDINGDEVLRRIQADPTTRNIPVIMVSADATSSQIAKLLATGARHYLTKPLDIEHLLEVFQKKK